MKQKRFEKIVEKEFDYENGFLGMIVANVLSLFICIFYLATAYPEFNNHFAPIGIILLIFIITNALFLWMSLNRNVYYQEIK